MILQMVLPEAASDEIEALVTLYTERTLADWVAVKADAFGPEIPDEDEDAINALLDAMDLEYGLPSYMTFGVLD